MASTVQLAQWITPNHRTTMTPLPYAILAVMNMSCRHGLISAQLNREMPSFLYLPYQ